MSYNIRNFLGADEKKNVTRVTDVIKKVKPDVVAIQEVDNKTRRSNFTDEMQLIGNITKMHYFFKKNIPRQDGEYGIGILSKEKPIKIYKYDLPGQIETRGILVAEFKEYIFMCTHNSRNQTFRMKSINILKKVINDMKNKKKPIFFAGDLNARPNNEYIKILKQLFKIISNPSNFTFRADKPTHTLDYIMYRDAKDIKMKVLSNKVLYGEIGSDHLPLIVKVNLKKFKKNETHNK